MIYFRDRKYGGTLNVSYFVKDGGEHLDLSRFHVGDKVSIFFRLTAEQQQVISERGDIEVTNGIEPSAFISFRVVERMHALSTQGGGVLGLSSESLVLEAEMGVWEDVLRWVGMGERPEWAEE
jgi:hypothetical protein